ncbi:MAG: dihydrofolate reductase family protein [Dehalococcoidales bacterium]|nr:dihydrofolate reductase family protein [Dehalococcoidales bacterium]
MGKVILYIAASRDGFIAGSDGDISWLDKYQGGAEDYGYSDFYKNVGAAIMGAKTYKKALTLNGGIDNNMPTYVITHRKLQTRADAQITLYSGNLTELISKIQKKTAKNIWLVGGGQLTQSFLKEDLIDEIILSTIPLILREGISLFGNISKEINLVLTKTKSYKSGIVQTHYKITKKQDTITRQ